MVVEKKIMVSQAADNLAQGLKALVTDVKKALKDGWQPGQDVPVILSAIYMDLITKIQDLGKLPAELAEEKFAFQRAWLEAGIDIEKELLS